ncbi:MAG: DUF255 domain-containing protein [Gammaproteobacteria bacterium]|nr:DUF255 domain-containing protein [Gammaproteobacteria bacterium]
MPYTMPLKNRAARFAFPVTVLSLLALYVAIPHQCEAKEDAKHQGEPNHLIQEKSPYLLQHAYNPVVWYPWGEEAFAKARRENKPIFLSVGYSTCYWCHVMEKESFEDPEVAEILNENFVAIKVDREERPDIDEQYMLATQLMTGRGGWPNSVWLTPDGDPWMAGTYFPKRQFMGVLSQLADIWENRRDEVDAQARQLASAIESAGAYTGSGSGELTQEQIDQAVAQLVASFDRKNAGFGSAPKFPPHGTLRLLLAQFDKTGNEELLIPATRTLDAMWLGGMHDHIGGGFHRYSTDSEWLVPHFEKMLYDNAQLLRIYAEAYALTDNSRYRQAVEDIFNWVEREMTSPEGAFYSAMDSGEVGKEGEAYVWQLSEIKEVLGDEDGETFAEIYQIERRGNFSEESTGKRTGANIPHLEQPIAEIDQDREESPEAMQARLAVMRDKLLARRQTREPPHKDDKVLTSWNGIMIGALAYAGRQLDNPDYTESAAKAADFILEKLRSEDGSLLRSYRDGRAEQRGFLDDYAFFIQALLELYRATGNERWLTDAKELGDILINDFEDPETGGFYYTSEDHETLIMRSKGLTGGGNLPSANGVAAQALLDLSVMTDDPRYTEAAARTIQSLADLMASRPFAQEHLLIAAADYLAPASVTTIATTEEASVSPVSPEADVTRRVRPVTIKAYASHLQAPPGQTLQVAVDIVIDEGWHLYGANPDINFLIPTTVQLKPSDAFSPGDITVPAPTRKRDPILKQAVNSYTGAIRFMLPVKISPQAKPGPNSLEIMVRTQACEQTRCLPPEDTLIRIPVQIVADASNQKRHQLIFNPSEPR